MSTDPQELAEAIDAAGALSDLMTPPYPFESCGLRPDGEVVCWGLQSWPLSQPQGVFVAISSGLTHGCGLRVSGGADCWGLVNIYGELDAPEGRFTAISASGSQTCGLRPDGSVECWGGVQELLEGVEPPAPDVAFPGGAFTAVSVGSAHACGLRPDGDVACWGTNWFGQVDAPAGPFVSVDAGASHSCGLRSDGSIDCWGEDSLDAAMLTDLGGIEFGGDEQAYVAHRRDEEASMADLREALGNSGSPVEPSLVAFMDLVGAVPEPELREEMARRAATWEPPLGPFVSVSAGDGFTCGLRLDGEVACWGHFAREEPRIPLEIYADVYGPRLRDFGHTVKGQVALGTKGFNPDFYPLYESLYGAQVWELDPSEYSIAGPDAIPVESMVADMELVDPPSGPFIAIEAGWRRACGLRPDGEIDCWGFAVEGSTPPPGPFATAPITAATVP